MADDTILNSGSGGDTIATDDIGGVKYPRSKIVVGADGTNDGDVSSSNPLPITVANTGANATPIVVDLGANNDVTLATLPDTAAGDLAAINSAVSGTLTVGSHAVTNAGTFAVQVDGAALTALQLIDDAVYTDGTGTPSKGLAVMGTDGTNPQLISVDSSGNVQVDIVSSAAIPITDNSGSITVDNAGTFAVQVDGTALTRLTDIETNTDYGAVTGGGVEASALRVTIASDSTGVISIDDNSGSITVDNGGTFAVQAAQSGTWNINDVSGTVSLPTGASTAANQSTIIGHVDGIETLLTTIDSDTSTLAVVGGGTEATALRVTLASDSTGVLSIDDNGGAITVDNGGTFAVQAAQSGTWNITDISGTVSLPTGAATAAKQPALGTAGTASTDVITVQGIASMTALVVDGSGVTQPVSGTVTANLSATDNAVLDVLETNTSGNTSHYRNIDANAEAEIKGSAGTLKWLHAINLTAAVAYLHLYDATAASVTPGTTTPNYTFAIPTAGNTNGAGFVLPSQIEFTNGITLVCTTTLDGSAGDPGTNGVVVNAGYV